MGTSALPPNSLSVTDNNSLTHNESLTKMSKQDILPVDGKVTSSTVDIMKSQKVISENPDRDIQAISLNSKIEDQEDDFEDFEIDVPSNNEGLKSDVTSSPDSREPTSAYDEISKSANILDEFEALNLQEKNINDKMESKESEEMIKNKMFESNIEQISQNATKISEKNASIASKDKSATEAASSRQDAVPSFQILDANSKQIEMKIAGKKEELSSHEKTLAALIKNIQDLNKQAQEVYEDRQAVAKDIQAENTYLQDAAKEIQAVSADRQAVAKKIQAESADLQVVAKEIHVASADRQIVTKDIQALFKESQAVDNEFQAAVSKATLLNKELENFTRLNPTSGKYEPSTPDQIEQSLHKGEEIHHSNGKPVVLPADKQDILDKIKNNKHLEKEISTLQEKKTLIQDKQNELQEKDKALQNKQNALQEKHKGLQNKQNELQEKDKVLKNKQNELQEEYKKHQNKLIELQNEDQKLVEKENNIQRDRKIKVAEKSEIEAKINTLKFEIGQLKQALAAKIAENEKKAELTHTNPMLHAQLSRTDSPSKTTSSENRSLLDYTSVLVDSVQTAMKHFGEITQMQRKNSKKIDEEKKEVHHQKIKEDNKAEDLQNDLRNLEFKHLDIQQKNKIIALILNEIKNPSVPIVETVEIKEFVKRILLNAKEQLPENEETILIEKLGRYLGVQQVKRAQA